MDAPVKTACPLASCTHKISTFSFPLQILSFPLTCSLDKEEITDNQETKRYRKSDWPAGSWLVASEKVKRKDSQATCAKSDWNTAELLASPSSAPPLNHSPINQLLTIEVLSLNSPGINLSPAAVSAYTMLPVPTSISPNPLQSLCRPGANWVLNSTSLNLSPLQLPPHLWHRWVLKLTASWDRGCWVNAHSGLTCPVGVRSPVAKQNR